MYHQYCAIHDLSIRAQEMPYSEALASFPGAVYNLLARLIIVS